MEPIKADNIDACVAACIAAAGRAKTHTITTESEFTAAVAAVTKRLFDTSLPIKDRTGIVCTVTQKPCMPNSYRGSVVVSTLEFRQKASGLYLVGVTTNHVSPDHHSYGGKPNLYVWLRVSEKQAEAIKARAIARAMSRIDVEVTEPA